MEINDFEEVRGVVPQENVVEGRMVCLVANVHSRNYGDLTDLPGAKLPDTRAEAATARFVLMFEQDNRSLPLYVPQPSFDWAMRYGWEQPANAPFATTVYLTKPGQQEGVTIPSGQPSAAYTKGIFTVPSGEYVYSANLEIPGTQLEVANDADDSAADSGKLKELSAGTAIAQVWEYESTTGKLTFRIL